MGKAALIVVMAVVMAGTVSMLSRSRSAYETTEKEASYDGKTLAREYANSGLSIAESNLGTDFSGYRPSADVTPYQEGEYEITVAGPVNGPVQLTVTGRYGRYSHTITGSMGRDGQRAIDALTVDGNVKRWEIKGTSSISGYDTNTDGTSGSGLDVHAIYAPNASGYTYLSTRLPAGRVVGVGGDRDATTDGTGIELASYVSDIMMYNGNRLTTYTKNQSFKNVTFGSPANPVMIFVDGNVVLDDNVTGYGVLAVVGDLTMQKDSRWEGLIYALDNGGKRTFKETSSVYGAVILQSRETSGETGSDAGLPGGHFDVDVFNAPTANEVYHQHMFDDKYSTDTINLLTPGCKSGKLCWSTIMAGKSMVFLEFDNKESSWGTYTISAGANGSVHPAVPAVSTTGLTNEGLRETPGGAVVPSILLDASRLSDLRVQFHALCSMEPSKPNLVQADTGNRDGAFRILVYNASNASGSWAKGSLLYEIATYHHDENATKCPPGSPDGTGSPASGLPMEVVMDNSATIRYSSEALSRLSTFLPSLSVSTGTARLQNVRETTAIEP